MMRLTVSVASRVCRVEKHQVAGFGGQQGGVDGFDVAHFAHQDDVGVLAQGGAQRASRNDGVSTSTSRWLTKPFLSRCRNSMGSSMVMMCSVPAWS